MMIVGLSCVNLGILSPFRRQRPPVYGVFRRPLALLEPPKQLQLQGWKRKSRLSSICRAVELSQDAPLAAAIGTCMLNSLIFTNPSPSDDTDEEDDSSAAISTTDARFAVMTIISFIPYFSCLSWVFALMDTGKQRYAVYALVYLAPYLRTNFSLSPEESWLPIASIILCIIHIQLEASATSGDLDGFNFFNEVRKRLGLVKPKETRRPTSLGKIHEEEKRQHRAVNLPSGQHQSRDEIRKWRVPTKPSEELEHLNEDGDQHDRPKH